MLEKIVTPAIDLIEIISARGNTSLGSTVHLTNSLRRDINAFAKRVSDAADEQEISRHINKNNMGAIMADMKNLLSRIEDVGGGRMACVNVFRRFLLYRLH